MFDPLLPSLSPPRSNFIIFKVAYVRIREEPLGVLPSVVFILLDMKQPLVKYAGA